MQLCAQWRAFASLKAEQHLLPYRYKAVLRQSDPNSQQSLSMSLYALREGVTRGVTHDFFFLFFSCRSRAKEFAESKNIQQVPIDKSGDKETARHQFTLS